MKDDKVKEIVFALIIFSVISLIFVSPIFRDIHNWGIQDWSIHLMYDDAAKTSIIEYKQFPLWSPWRCGGSPILAHPVSKVLSPLFLFQLILGTVIGIKIEILLHLIVGMWGMYILSRDYRLNRLISYFPPILYFVNGMFSLPIAGGMTWMLTLAYVPWAFLFFRRSFKKKINTIFCAVFMVLIFFGGGVYHLIMLSLMMAIYSFFLVFEKKSIKYLKITALIFLFTLGLGAIKFFPTMEYLKEYPRIWHSNEKEGFSLISLYKSLTLRDQSFLALNRLEGPGKNSFINGLSYLMDENGMYIGYIPIILGLFGLIFFWKKDWKLILIFFIFLWISFGSMTSFSIWNLIHKFPLFSSLRCPQRFRIIFMLIFSIFCGIGLNRLYIKSLGFAKQKVVNIIFIGLIILITYDLILVNGNEFNNSFSIKPPTITKEKMFIQYNLAEYEPGSKEIFRGAYKQFSKDYYAFKANKGAINCLRESINQPKNPIPFDHEDYIGEVFLFKQKTPMDILYWSPNRVVVDVSSKKDDYLVLNQNLIKGWKVKGSKDNKIESLRGLIATKVDKKTTNVIFYYLPTSFIIGAFMSLVTLIGIVIFFAILKRKMKGTL